MKHIITFLATFPPIQSAIKITGNGDGMRIQLDIPESEMGNAIELLAMRNDVLSVTIKQDENGKKRQSNHKKLHI